MVKSCTPLEIDKLARVFLVEQSVADKWQREEATKGFVQSLARHDYLTLTGKSVSLSNEPMFEVGLEYPVTRREAEWVQRDLAAAWNQVTTRAAEAYYAVRNTAAGFEIDLLALFKGSYLFGRVQVTGVQIDRNLAIGKKSDRLF